MNDFIEFVKLVLSIAFFGGCLFVLLSPLLDLFAPTRYDMRGAPKKRGTTHKR